MASPIFISNPSPTFSWTAIFKGCQFAFLGSYRLLQNQLFFENSKYFKFTLVGLQYSILVQLVLSFPMLVTKFAYWVSRFLVSKEFDIQNLNLKISFFIYDILQLQTITLLVIYTLYYDVFEEIFNSGLQYIDQVTLASKRNQTVGYSTGLGKCKRVEIRNRSFLSNWIAKLNWLSIHQCNHISQLFRSYSQLVLMNIFIYLCTYAPYIDSLLVAFIISRSFNSKLGTSVTFLVFIIGLTVSPYTLLEFYSFYSITQLSVKYLLNIPYFQKLNFTDLQADNWLDSRAGLSFGFGSVFTLAAWKFNYIALLILLLEQLSLAYFISQATDPIPETLTEPWLLTQIYWTRIYNKLTVSSDGFKPIPLSYIIFDKESGSSDTSAFVTPISSTTSLNRLNE